MAVRKYTAKKDPKKTPGLEDCVIALIFLLVLDIILAGFAGYTVGAEKDSAAAITHTLAFMGGITIMMLYHIACLSDEKKKEERSPK